MNYFWRIISLETPVFLFSLPMNMWPNNWQSIFDGVEGFDQCAIITQEKKYPDKFFLRWKYKNKTKRKMSSDSSANNNKMQWICSYPPIIIIVSIWPQICQNYFTSLLLSILLKKFCNLIWCNSWLVISKNKLAIN